MSPVCLSLYKRDKNMDLKKIKYFLQAAESLNLSKAAQQLELTPAALYHQINHLEEQLRLSLFNRAHAQLSLTDEGKVFYEQSKKLLQQLNMTVAKTRYRAKRKQGQLKIACSLIQDTALLTKIISNLKDLNFQPVLDFSDKTHTDQLMMNELVDIRFMSKPYEDKIYKSKKLETEKMIFLVKKGYFCTSKKVVTLKDLYNLNIIYMQDSWSKIIHQSLFKISKKNELDLNFHYPVDNELSMLNYVRLGIGCAVVPLSKVPESKYIDRIPCGFDLPDLSVYLVYKKLDSAWITQCLEKI